MLPGAFFLPDHGRHSEVQYVAVQWGPRGHFQLGAWKLTAKSSQICAFHLCGHQMRQKIQLPISPNCSSGVSMEAAAEMCWQGSMWGQLTLPSIPSTRWDPALQVCSSAIWLSNTGPVLQQILGFNKPQVFTARIPIAFCARAFYGKLHMSPLSPAQTFRLLWI